MYISEMRFSKKIVQDIVLFILGKIYISYRVFKFKRGDENIFMGNSVEFYCHLFFQITAGTSNGCQS